MSKFKDISSAKIARKNAEKTIKDGEAVRKLPGGGTWKFDAENEKVIILSELDEADALQLASDLADFYA